MLPASLLMVLHALRPTFPHPACMLHQCFLGSWPLAVAGWDVPTAADPRPYRPIPARMHSIRASQAFHRLLACFSVPLNCMYFCSCTTERLRHTELWCTPSHHPSSSATVAVDRCRCIQASPTDPLF